MNPDDIERRVLTVRRYFTHVWNEGESEAIGELVARDYVGHDPDFKGDMARELLGPEGARDYVGLYKFAFPDLKVELQDIFGAGDRVSARWFATGTHAADFCGVAPFDEVVRFAGMSIFRLDTDDLIAEEWTMVDVYGILHQIGGLEELNPGANEVPIGQPEDQSGE
jgi:steroid delta-isomerase-like uncharacterized protein